MERPAGITYAARQRLAIFIILIFHFVGLAGFLFQPTYSLMLQLVPFHLCLMLVVTLALTVHSRPIALAGAAFIFAAGFLLEVAGVSTGKIFGVYQYGPTLGVKLWHVPLTMGINWVVLMLATVGIVNRVNISLFYKCIIVGALMVMLDGCIEPVAVKLNFWQWHHGRIPLQNYIAWFIASTLLAWPLLSKQIFMPFRAGLAMYIVQAVFFTSLWQLLA